MDDITNFVQLADDIGTSGQPRRDQFAAIAAAGYSVVVNLALPTSDHAIPDEGAIVTGLGMRYVHIPVAFDAPAFADLRQFFGVMAAFAGERIWVHCVVNWRVSAFTYLYLRHVRGVDEARARSPVLDAWVPTMDAVWRTFLAEAPARLRAPGI
ncbi:MAG TPA: protein tyrosine phosphatase family protein [Pseudomonadales bacterium]|nr:protein tyrosine phosphatase family protein [Pseudomonadales bacterium]